MTPVSLPTSIAVQRIRMEGALDSVQASDASFLLRLGDGRMLRGRFVGRSIHGLAHVLGRQLTCVRKRPLPSIRTTVLAGANKARCNHRKVSGRYSQRGRRLFRKKIVLRNTVDHHFVTISLGDHDAARKSAWLRLLCRAKRGDGDALGRLLRPIAAI